MYLLITVLSSQLTIFLLSSYFKYTLTLILPAFLVIFRKDTVFKGPVVKFIALLQVVSMAHFTYYLIYICSSDFELAMTGFYGNSVSYTSSMFQYGEIQGVYEKDIELKSKIDFNANVSYSLAFWGAVAMYKNEFIRCIRVRHYSSIAGHFGAFTFSFFGFLHLSNPDYTTTQLARYLLTGSANPNPTYIPTFENIINNRVQVDVLFNGYMGGKRSIVFRVPSSSTE
jgi:hypothetical protein